MEDNPFQVWIQTILTYIELDVYSNSSNIKTSMLREVSIGAHG